MALQLRVLLTQSHQTKAMKFNRNMTVADVCAEIQEKTGEGGRDFGLVQAGDAETKRNARWLRPDQTLQFYEIRPNDLVEYRKKQRTIKVKFVDEVTKTFLIDESLPVSDIVALIGQKMDIKNTDEFSLGVEETESKSRKASKDKGNQQAQPPKMKWLNSAQTLQDQGVSEETVLILKKKWYVDDANVDASDQVALHLVYVQCHAGVVAGDHPISKEEAAMFGALQCQILFGNYNADKHTTKFVDARVEDILPPAFAKGGSKALWPNLVKEWRSLVNMNETNAKYRYVQACRGLKTYGITYYHVKFKPAGSSKMRPLMVGITHDTILMVDSETRNVLKEHPLIHLKRWAAAPTTFTFDFGDYADSYMTVATNEGEAISSLLAGYIDIILKRRKDGGVIIEEQEGEKGEEDFVASVHGAASRAITTTVYDAGAGDNSAASMLSGGGQIPGLSPAVAGMLGKATDLGAADDAILRLMGDLMNPLPIGMHGSLTPEQLRQELALKNQQLASAAGDLIDAVMKGDGANAIPKALPDLAMNLANLIGAAKLAAAAAKGDVSLLDGAKSVSEALRKVLAAAGEVAANPDSVEAKMKLAQAAALLQATTAALNAQCIGNKADDASRDLLRETAKAVAQATRDFLDTSDASVAQADPGTKQKQKAGAKVVEMRDATVSDTVDAVAPVVVDPNCRKYVANAAQALTQACNALLAGTQEAVRDPQQRGDLLKTAKTVNEALSQLMNSMACVGSQAEADKERMAAAAFEIQDAVSQLLNSERGDVKAIQKASQAIQAASKTLIDAAKGVARAADPEEKNRLLNCMKDLTKAVTDMLKTANEAANKPNDDALARQLRDQASAVGEATKRILGPLTTKQAAMAALRTAAKACAAAASGLVAESKDVSRRTDPKTRNDLNKAAEDAAHAVADLVATVKDSWANPESREAEKALRDTAQAASKPTAGLVATARAAVPRLNDIKDKTNLNAAATNLSNAIRKLLDALNAAKDADGHTDVDEALQSFLAAVQDLDAALANAEQGRFDPIPGQTKEGALALLDSSARALQASADEVAQQSKVSPKAMGPPAKRAAAELLGVLAAAKAVASTSDQPSLQSKILKAARGVATETAQLLNSGRALSVNPSDPKLGQNVEHAREALDSALEYLLASAGNTGAGAEECDRAADAITKNARDTLTGFPSLGSENGGLQDFAEQLQQSMKALEAALGQVADAARNNPKALGPAANLTASTMPPIMTAANNASAKTPDRVAGANILSKGKQLADDTAHLLGSAKHLATRPGDRDADQALAASMKDVKGDMAELLRAVDAAIPGKRDIADAQDTIAAAAARLTKPSAPTENSQIHLREIAEAAKRLADSVGRIVASSRQFPEKLGPYSKDAANAVSDLVDASKDAASNDPGAMIHLSSARIGDDAQKAVQDPADLANVVDKTKDVARDASDLLANVKRAAQQENDPAKKRELIQAAEKAAQATAELGKAAHGIGEHQPGAEQQLANAARALEASIQSMARANTRAAGKTGGQDFVPLLEAARRVADETAKLVDALKTVAGRPKDIAAQNQLVAHAQATGESIRKIVEAAENLTYGHRETKEAIETIQKAIGELDSTAAAATVPGLLQTPSSKAGISNQQSKEELIALSRDLAGVTGNLVSAAKSNPRELGPAAKGATQIVPKIVESSVALASLTADPKVQQEQLHHVKGTVDALLVLVRSARATSGNPHDKETLMKLAEAAKTVSGCISEMVAQLRGGVLGLRACDEAMKKIEALAPQLDSAGSSSGKSYAQCGEDLTHHSKALLAEIARMASAAKNAQADPAKVGDACLAVANLLPQLVAGTKAAAAANTDPEISARLLAGGKGVLDSSRDCVASTKLVAADRNPSSLAQLADSQRAVTQSLGGLLNAVREGATLERDADLANAKIQSTTADLDSAALFAAATAGQMEVQLAQGSTLETCQSALTAVAKQLAAGAAGVAQAATSHAQQEEIGRRFKDYAKEVDDTGKATKAVASLMGDLAAQQQVLAACKAMALASQSLILSAKDVATRPASDHSANEQLNKHASSVAASIRELIAVSEAASQEAVRGVRELDKARSEIEKLIQTLNAPSSNRIGNPREVLPSLRNLGTCTGQLVANALSDKDALCRAAQDTSRFMEEMISNVLGAVNLAEGKPDVQRELKESARNTATAAVKLLEETKKAKDTPDSMQALSGLSESFADRIMDVVKALRRVPGGEGITGLHETTGPDFDDIAEQELRKAAKMIEDAANRLLASRPRVVSNSDLLTEEDINSAILEAARAITIATASLVRSATLAQRERINKRRDPKTKNAYRADPAWANGLISAAQTVGGTTQDLVNSANGFVQKEEGSDDAILISAARQVVASTARLMAASRAKSDPFSDVHQNLGNASKEVANATQLLVDAARKAADISSRLPDSKTEENAQSLGTAAKVKQEMEAQARLERLRADMEAARLAYSRLNEEGYGPGTQSQPQPAPSASAARGGRGRGRGGRGAPSRGGRGN